MRDTYVQPKDFKILRIFRISYRVEPWRKFRPFLINHLIIQTRFSNTSANSSWLGSVRRNGLRNPSAYPHNSSTRNRSYKWLIQWTRHIQWQGSYVNTAVCVPAGSRILLNLFQVGGINKPTALANRDTSLAPVCQLSV